VKILSAADVARYAPYKDIVEALRQGFREPAVTPVRHHHEPVPSTTLLLMPAWTAQWTGLKIVTVKTDNPALGLPTVQGSYLLLDNTTGAPVCMMDGTELTRRRTAAASALAADYLARPDALVHAIIGAGALCAHFARAHQSVRPIGRVLICNRSIDKAEAVAQSLRHEGMRAEVSDIETAVRQADIVSGITSSNIALIKGDWIKPGTHIDLAGAFKPQMRETDAAAVGKASVFVDTRDGARAEAGDLIQAQAEGKFDFSDVKADLFELTQGKHRGRQNGREVTLFKSCGTALEDLATAVMVHLRSETYASAT
jgi:ornithine cyclodeaminase/alanine dehydrogenase-like protein (mu-crystallin family)